MLSICSLSTSTSRKYPQQLEENCVPNSRRETKQKTLEEIAAAFSDHLVEVDEDSVAVEGLAIESKASPEEHIEDVA
jgi:hypothetical protein